MGQAVHQEAIRDINNGPTQAMARRICQIIKDGGDENLLLCNYKMTPDKPWLSVTATDVIKMVRETVKILNLHCNDIDQDLIRAHSLCTGGAMALHLQGYPDTTIMKYCFWSGLAFLMYIHNQIAYLSQGILQK